MDQEEEDFSLTSQVRLKKINSLSDFTRLNQNTGKTAAICK